VAIMVSCNTFCAILNADKALQNILRDQSSLKLSFSKFCAFIIAFILMVCRDVGHHAFKNLYDILNVVDISSAYDRFTWHML